MQTIKVNLAQVRRDIREGEKQYGRKPSSVALLAVSKGQSVEKIEAALEAGQQAFGESYLQEALTKITQLADKPIIWHFIGLIQRNKAKKIAEHFAWVQSVSDTETAKRLNDLRPSHLPPLNICLQVNISQEKTKSGVSVEALPLLAAYSASLPRLRLRGLMAIPAPKHTFAEQVSVFHPLRLLFEEMSKHYPSMDTLSLGMSSDLAAAIAEGSTMVRIGTKIFGERNRHA